MTKEKYDVTDEVLQNSEYTTKENINNKITAASKGTTERNEENEIQNKLPPRRYRRMDPTTSPKWYMLRLGRTQASTIFKARTRMLHLKNNYKNAYINLACTACQKEAET